MAKQKSVKKSKKKRHIFLWIILILLVMTGWYELPEVEFTEIGPEYGANVRFALVTDLHSCYYGKDQRQLLLMIDREEADAVLLSGDIFDDRLDEANAKIFLEQIAAKYPCFYVTGNHEFWSGRQEEFKEYLRGIGITVLEGNYVTVEIKGRTFDICGVDDPTYMSDEDWEKQLDRAYPDSENFKILLSHRPERVDFYKNYGFDMVVCGHAHGGQWKIPFTQYGTAAPNQGLFPKYVDGSYELENGTRMIVSRGLARERMPYPRFFNHPEVVMIDVRK